MGKKLDKVDLLGIVGSPRPGGNTEILVDEVLGGAREAGLRTEKVLLRNLDIGPCRGCDSCGKTGKCVQKDDMPGLLVKMQESGAWVLGTPVYYWGPSAQFKAFMDRWYGAGRIVSFKTKRAIVVVPLGSGSAVDARHTVGMLTDALGYQGTRVLTTITAAGVFEKGAVRGKAKILASARKAGKESHAL
jgi:multimeric flavodoxin WrbA